MAFLQIKNFKKSFSDVEVLKGISLDIEKGEVLTVIGSSGSGKTTFLRCLNFLETPDVGEMVLNGQVLLKKEGKTDKQVSEKELRQNRLNFGLVFQNFNLFPQYNVLENITLAPTLMVKESVKQLKKEGKTKREIATIVQQKRQEIESEANLLLEKIGLIEKAKSYPCELSGGQCQRVAIARALALKPKILCFDEPTSALDPELTGEVLKVIRSLKSQDRTMIIVTHEMGFAKSVSDKVVFMANGRVEECGTPDQIFDNPKSQKLQAFLSSITNKDI